MSTKDVVLISIDSLRRDFLGAYENSPTCTDYTVETPNFDRFADRATIFENHFAGSLPCMPARREFLTGIMEFPWRPWGNVEPFDKTIPELIRSQETVSKIITDHYHYLEHNGHGYCEVFDGYELIRGHEFDSFRTTPRFPDQRLLSQIDADNSASDRRSSYARNISEINELDESEFFAPQVFSRSVEWLNSNQNWDNRFLYIDSFDVHEPFHCPEPYASMYTNEDLTNSDLPLWPRYGRVDEGNSALSEREISFIRSQFAGKTTMVDRWFGRILDRFDRNDLWDDTILILTTDHGFMLGEHGWMAKNDSPVYNEIANTPLIIWDPESNRKSRRISEVTSAVDIYATILDAMDTNVPEQTHSQSLLPLLRDQEENHRDWAIYGYFGSGVNITDGEYTYMNPCDEKASLYCYSTMQMPLARGKEAQPEAISDRYLPYTKVPVWRYPMSTWQQNSQVHLYDLQKDRYQKRNIAKEEPETRERMNEVLYNALDELEVPEEMYERLQ